MLRSMVIVDHIRIHDVVHMNGRGRRRRGHTTGSWPTLIVVLLVGIHVLGGLGMMILMGLYKTIGPWITKAALVWGNS